MLIYFLMLGKLALGLLCLIVQINLLGARLPLPRTGA